MEALLIRADANAEIGAGHVMRCLALAQEWRDQGGYAVFAMAECAPAIRERVAAEHCGVVDVPAAVGSKQDYESLRQYADHNQPSWIAVDGYRFGAEYHRAIREGPWKFLCIDDDGRYSESGADLILNQNMSASRAMYVNANRSLLLLGSGYVLLRKEFFRWRDWSRRIPPVAKSVLVTLGGSTQMDVARTVLAALSRIRMEDVVVKFVIGGSTLSPDSIEQTSTFPAITYLKNPANMPELMAAADVAISAAGATCWELCFLGVPSLLIDVAPNQTPNAQALHRGGYAIHAGASDGLSFERLATQLQELLNSPAHRQRLSNRCRSLVNGSGAARVVAAMRSEQLALRRSAEKDADLAVRE